MNDFLKNMKSKDKRYDRSNRKNYNSNYGNNYNSYHGNNQRNANGNVKNPSHGRSNSQDKFFASMSQMLPEVKEMVQKMAEAQDRRAQAEERKAAALEEIARILAPRFSNAIAAPEPAVPSEPPAPQPAETVESADEKTAAPDADAVKAETAKKSKKPTIMAREEVLKIIFDMREGGATFGEIASHLEDLNIPTFSGKGKWHAQTIHRVCQSA